MQEIWKDVCGYEGYYQVSNLGNVKSLDRIDCRGRHLKGKIVPHFSEKDGYLIVSFCKNGIAKHFRVHRLVASAFIQNPHNLSEVNHKDENKKNNCAENLEWCNTKYNINYGKRNQRVSEALSGEKTYNHKLTEEQVKEIRSTYQRRSKDFNAKKLSKMYGVSLSHISRIINKKRWR